MTAVTHTAVPWGIGAVPVTVTTEPAPRFEIHGLASEAAEREVRIRVETACRALGFEPAARVTVEADCLGAFPIARVDLAVAVAALAAAGQVELEPYQCMDPRCPGASTYHDHPTTMLYGELGLDGQLRPVRGLYAALLGDLAIVPRFQAVEASAAQTVGQVRAATTLGEVVAWFGGAALDRIERGPEPRIEAHPVVAAHSRHHTEWVKALRPRKGTPAVLLIGPPGSGKVLEARHAATLLPALDGPDAAEVLAIWSVAGLFTDRPLVPFRAPHHTVSEAGLLGTRGRPGEVSLAHGGCLLLDEVAEFRRVGLQALAVAIREGTSGWRPTLPSKPALVVGTCTHEEAERARKLYPWTDEIEVPRVTVAELMGGAS